MSRRTQILVIVGFLLAISAPLVAATTGFSEGRAIENRALAGLPPLGGTALLHQDTFKDLDRYTVDRLPWRDRAVLARQRLSLALFGEPFNDKAIVGREGWVYFAEGLRRPCLTAEEVAGLRTALADLQALMAAAGKAFRLLVAPDKETLYPQYLKDRDRRRSCIEGNRVAADEVLRGVGVGWSSVIDADPSGTPVYYRGDSHWNQLGVTMGTRDLVDGLAPGLFDQSAYTVIPGGDRHSGDVLGLLGTPGIEVGDRFDLVRPGVELVSSELMGRELDPFLHERRTGAGLVPGRVVVIHDSFGDALRRQAGPWFADITWASILPQASDREATFAVARDADTVVLVLAQRNLALLVPLLEAARVGLAG